MDSLTAQNRVLEAVKERGYRDGWTATQFLGRQIAKLAEELAEAADLAPVLPGTLWRVIEDAGDVGKEAFDHWQWKGTVGLYTPEGLRDLALELADMQVVLFNAISAVNELAMMDYDLVAMAVKKAEADVQRGLRE